MDPIALAYYAIICGLLSLGAPRIGGFALRFAVGALVGLGAAGGLPLVRAALAPY